MPLHTYDPKQIMLIISGFPISGYADGTFVKAERSSDSYMKQVGTDGITSRAKSADKSGTITITLTQTSPSNDILSGMEIADSLSPIGAPIPIMIKDNVGTTTIVSAFGWVKKPAAVEFGKEITNREWTLECADLDFTVGGNLAIGF